MSDALATFEAERPRLLRLAWRMLGSAAEAEDAVQTAWLRWQDQPHEAIANPAAWLTRTVGRIALDALKSARARRETYVGPWLPEPLVEEPEADLADDLTATLMLALERLSPLERAAFLLHDIFGVGFDEVAATLGRGEAACRQLAARARAHLRAGRSRYQVPQAEGERIAQAFFAASREGDVERLQRLLAADVVFYSDGGGVRPAALNPVHGRDNVARMIGGLVAKYGAAGRRLLRVARIDGLPGIVTLEADGIVQTTAFDIGPEGVTAIYVMRNPEKLGRISLQ